MRPAALTTDTPHKTSEMPSTSGASSISPPPSSSSPAECALAPNIGLVTPSSAPGLPGPGQPCCENGRPILADPITGQTVCSCQYDKHILNYQRLAASGGLPLGIYNPAATSAYGPGATEQSFLPGLGPEQLQSAFYPTGANGFNLKENLEAWRNLPYAAASMYYPYDGASLAYPFGNGYGMDLNGARRKNATRETTSTLKAWLSEHRKNPYPTKGEKIMLAIITKMTLTQVSTWFANARRRLKKENKMTWSPRNRCDEDEAADAEAENNDRSGAESANGDGQTGRERDEVDSDIDVEDDSGPTSKKMRRCGSPSSSISDSDVQSRSSPAPPKSASQHHRDGHGTSHGHPLNSHLPPNLHVPAHLYHPAYLRHPLQSQHPHTIPISAISKPRIWSIVDIATSGSSAPSTHSTLSNSSPLSGPSPLSRSIVKSESSFIPRARGFPGVLPP